MFVESYCRSMGAAVLFDAVGKGQRELMGCAAHPSFCFSA
jgi:hypothetical protein